MPVFTAGFAAAMTKACVAIRSCIFLMEPSKFDDSDLPLIVRTLELMYVASGLLKRKVIEADGSYFISVVN